MQVVGSVINGHLGVAARNAALRRSSPTLCPQVPTLIAAEFPILAVEAALAALTSFTLVGPLGLQWWVPVIGIVVIGVLSAGLRRLAVRKGRELWRGLAVVRMLGSGSRVVAFVLVAVFAQILRNWLLLRAVGVDASLFDAIAVLIAVVTLGQLPVGPSVGAAPPASQVREEIREIANARALNVAAVYGGAGIERQSKLARRAHVIVGRFEDMINRGAVPLAALRVLVLHEADRMLDMGFRPVVDRIVAQTPRSRQTLFVFATLDGEVGRLARLYPSGAPPRARADPRPPPRCRPPLGRG